MNENSRMKQQASNASDAVTGMTALMSAGNAEHSARPQMTPWSRIIIAVAALLLSTTYFLPLWQISLEAPQYPEGLGMEIWINQIRGQHEGDLSKINNLNHYIGMKQIVQESIPELKIMPWIMRVVMLIGFIVALVGRRSVLLIWLVLFFLVCIAGLVDFYLWSYDYGHNLDLEKAIIKVPGMTYQPPLIGAKKLLNFRAVSLPGLGGWAIIVALCAAASVWLSETYVRRIPTRVTLATVPAGILALAFAIGGCGGNKPVPIQYGHDQCDYCKMTIADASFGTELITGKGKVLKFDSIECLAAADLEKARSGETVRSLWVTNFNTPETFLNVTDAAIILAHRQRSPMGIGLVAVDSDEAATELIREVGGNEMNWDEIRRHVARAWSLTTQ